MSRFDVKPPAQQEANPYIPKGPPEPLVFEAFEGINTQTTRPGVDDKQMSWCDGWMPIAPRKLRTLYGVGDPIIFDDSQVVSFFAFANIGATPYAIVVHNDGSIHAVNTTTYTQTQIAAAATITSASRLNVGISQYGSRYVMIVAVQTNGYFLWDGTTFYKAGGLAPPVTITNGGTGYATAPTVAASGGSGSGATFAATVSGGVVTGIQIVNPGTGYLSGETVTLGFTGGGGSAAAATITLMPFAISGTTIEVYAGRVWIANGATVTYSAPGSIVDFSSASGGGNFTSSDSFLRVRYVQLIQTNGFLYLLADSSINYISGVQTTGSPPVTTFTNQNADPEVGTPWPSTVNTFGRNILFANAFGAHVSYGAAVNKISDMLDGIYNSVDNFGGLIPSAAKAIIFGKRVWMLLLPIIDPISGQQVNKIFMWDGKRWWSSPQEVAINYIQYQEIDSVITAWGSTNTAIYPLFQQPTIAFDKVVQSKLWDKAGGYMFMHTNNRLWGMAQYYSIDLPTLDITIDNENSGAEQAVALTPTALTWTNSTGATITWTNSLGDPLLWFTAGGITVMPPQSIGQAGVLQGMTITTRAADMALISMAMDSQIAGTRI